MRYKIIALLGAIAISTIPTISSASTLITVINNTDSFGTGYAGFSPCSTIAGDQGIIQPHSSKTIDISGVSLFCGNSDCDGHVFLTRDCSGKQLAKVVINATKGIVSITNYDKGHYKVTLSDNVAQIDPI